MGEMGRQASAMVRKLILLIEWIEDKFGRTMSLEIPVYYDLLFKQLELDRDYTLYELGL